MTAEGKSEEAGNGRGRCLYHLFLVPAFGVTQDYNALDDKLVREHRRRDTLQDALDAPYEISSNVP